MPPTNDDTAVRDLPTLGEIEEDLRRVLKSGLRDIRVARLRALPRLVTMRPEGVPPPAGAADIADGLRRAIGQLDVRQARIASTMFGIRSPDLRVGERIEQAGRLMVPRRGLGTTVAAQTMRNSGRIDQILEDVAVTVRDAELHYFRTGERRDQLPALRELGPRAYVALEEEGRLGYRWISYERRLRGPFLNAHGNLRWDDQATIVIEPLRSGVRVFEIDYYSWNPGAPEAEPVWSSYGTLRTIGRSIGPRTSHISDLMTRVSWYRATFGFEQDLPVGAPVEVVVSRPSEAEPHGSAEDDTDSYVTHLMELPLGDLMAFLRLRIEIVGIPRANLTVRGYEQCDVGPLRFGPHEIPLTIDDQRGEAGVECHVALATSNPAAGVTYMVDVEFPSAAAPGSASAG